MDELVIADRDENFTDSTVFETECTPELYDNPNFDDILFSIVDDFNTCGVDIEVSFMFLKHH